MEMESNIEINKVYRQTLQQFIKRKDLNTALIKIFCDMITYGDYPSLIAHHP